MMVLWGLHGGLWWFYNSIYDSIYDGLWELYGFYGEEWG